MQLSVQFVLYCDKKKIQKCYDQNKIYIIAFRSYDLICSCKGVAVSSRNAMGQDYFSEHKIKQGL